MRIKNGKVVSMWIENNQSEIGLAVVCPAALGYKVIIVRDSITTASHHYLGEVLLVDIDTNNVVRH